MKLKKARAILTDPNASALDRRRAQRKIGRFVVRDGKTSTKKKKKKARKVTIVPGGRVSPR